MPEFREKLFLAWPGTFEEGEMHGPTTGASPSGIGVQDTHAVSEGLWSGRLQAPLPKASRLANLCLLYTSPSPRDVEESRMPSSA